MTGSRISHILNFAAVVAAVGGSAVSDAEQLKLREGTVIQAVAEDRLTIKGSREGDVFCARIDNDRDIPRGTRAEGRVVEVRQKEGKRPGSMVLEIHHILLPDGTREPVQAVPVAWNERNLTRDANGRFQAKAGIPKEKCVLGGLAGGILIGSLAKKPFEGAFIGALAGILMAESENAQSGDLVLRRGDKLGVYIEKEVTLNWGRDKDLRSEKQSASDRAEGDRELTIQFDDRTLEFGRNEQPFKAGGVVMVPLESAAKQLNIEVDVEPGRDLILIEGELGLARLNRGSREYRVNEEHRTLPRNIGERDGVLYIPLEVLRPVVRGILKVDGTKLEDYE